MIWWWLIADNQYDVGADLTRVAGDTSERKRTVLGGVWPNGA